MRQRGIFEKVPGSGEWWIRYADATGRIRREKAGTKSGAIALYHKRKQQVLEGRKLPEKLRSASASFDEIIGDALEHSSANKVPAAHRNDLSIADAVRDWLGGRAAEEITPQEIERRLADLAEQGRAPATLNRYRAFLSLAYSLAIQNGKLATNPVRQVKRRKENNARVRFLEDEEETRARSKIRELCPEHEPELDLALHTGMRRGEQYRLRWQDVDLRRGIITIPRSKHGELRRIPINSVARATLLVLRADSGVGYVCPGSDGPRSQDQRCWFEEVIEFAGIQDFRWHDLRHTFASRLVMAGVDLRTVQELMGHKTIAMTLRYVHLAPAHQQEAIERLAQKRTDTRTSTEQKTVVEVQSADVA